MSMPFPKHTFSRAPTSYNVTRTQFGSGNVQSGSVLQFDLIDAPGEFLGFQLWRTAGSSAAFAYAWITIIVDDFIVFDDWLYVLFGAWQYYAHHGHFATTDIIDIDKSYHSFRFRFTYQEYMTFIIGSDDVSGTNVFMRVWYRQGG